MSQKQGRHNLFIHYRHGRACFLTQQYVSVLILWRLVENRDFREKNTRGFAWEFLRSGQCYRPGKRLKRRGKSSSLHSKKKFFLGI